MIALPTRRQATAGLALVVTGAPSLVKAAEGPVCLIRLGEPRGALSGQVEVSVLLKGAGTPRRIYTPVDFAARGFGLGVRRKGEVDFASVAAGGSSLPLDGDALLNPANYLLLYAGECIGVDVQLPIARFASSAGDYELAATYRSPVPRAFVQGKLPGPAVMVQEDGRVISAPASLRVD